LTPEQREEVVLRARNVATESGLLSDPEKAIVTTVDPKLSYYLMAGPGFAQYFITWTLSDETSITIYGEGNLLLLEGAKTVRKPNKRAGVDAGFAILLAFECVCSGTTQRVR